MEPVMIDGMILCLHVLAAPQANRVCKFYVSEQNKTKRVCAKLCHVNENEPPLVEKNHQYV